MFLTRRRTRPSGVTAMHTPAATMASMVSSSAFHHVINAPIEKVDIADCLFHLPEGEYQRYCPSDHISCTTTPQLRSARFFVNMPAPQPRSRRWVHS